MLIPRAIAKKFNAMKSIPSKKNATAPSPKRPLISNAHRSLRQQTQRRIAPCPGLG